MYTLYSAVPAFGTRASSPFGVKAESLLRLANVTYTRINVAPNRGPRNKLPFLTTPEGDQITDSWNIRRHLVDHGHLSLAPYPMDTLVRRLVEEHLYFAQMYFRWTHHLDEVRAGLFSDVPWPIRSLVVAAVYRQVQRTLVGQGLGRRPEAEILAVVNVDLDALEAALEGRRFFGGVRLAVADVSAHGLLDQLIPSTFDDALTDAVRQRPRLVTYYHRVDTAIYEDEALGEGDECSTPC